MIDLKRRTILKSAGATLAALTGPVATAAAAQGRSAHVTLPGWEERPLRWFQLAFTEDDPGAFDPDFWMDYFRQIKAEGICLSAGGGTAFYPTQIPHHGMSANMDGQDPFGLMAERCAAEGMNILARIDPHAMPASAFEAHPEWAQRALDGTARRHQTAEDLYYTCSFGPYSTELVPLVLDEVARLYPVDGFFGNRWRNMGVCYCDTCQRLYREALGRELPATNDPATEEGRIWAEWSQNRMLRIVDLWNQTIQNVRPNAFFIPGVSRNAPVDFDGREVGERLPMGFADRQARADANFWFGKANRAWDGGRIAKESRAFLFDKPVGHIISVGVEEVYRWKDSVQSDEEIRIWAASTMAQGSRPWITKFNAKPLDTRWMAVVSNIYNWHADNEAYFRNTRSLARVAMVDHTKTGSYLGGLAGRVDYEAHKLGFYQALVEAGIQFDMVDDAYLDAEHLERFDLLILCNAAVLSDHQCAQLRAFVARGGSIVATHQTSLYDEHGNERPDFALADLFGCHYAGTTDERMQNAYLTLRHPHQSLAGLEDVSRTIASVKRVHVRPDADTVAPLTLVPSYPDLPMERVFTDVLESDIPMALCRESGSGGRVAYLPMDLDRTFYELKFGDHMKLLAGMVRWALPGPYPIEVDGPGIFDLAYWQQERSLAAHLVNYNNPMTLEGYYREILPTGPYEVSLALPSGTDPVRARLLEAGQSVDFGIEGGRMLVTVPQVAVHEVIAIDLA